MKQERIFISSQNRFMIIINFISVVILNLLCGFLYLKFREPFIFLILAVGNYYYIILSLVNEATLSKKTFVITNIIGSKKVKESKTFSKVSIYLVFPLIVKIWFSDGDSYLISARLFEKDFYVPKSLSQINSELNHKIQELINN